MRPFPYPLLLILFGLLLFHNIFSLGFFADDYLQITENTYVHSVFNIPEIFTLSLRFFNEENFYSYTYRPVFYSIYAFLYSLGNGSPLPFHVFQVFLHITNSILVYLAFSRFFKKPLGFALALIFLVHPVNEEVAAYIANTQDVLFFFFGLIAFLIVQNSRTLNLKRAILVALFLIFSVLSKETGVIIILAILLYIFIFNKNGLKFYLFTIIPGSILYLFMRFGAQETTFLTVTNKTVSIQDMSLMERIIISPKILVFYLKDLIMPYPKLPDLNYLKNPDVNSSILPFILLIAALIFFCSTGFLIKKHFSQYFKLFVFFSFLFISGIFLHSQILPLDVIIAKRWLYLPIVGFLGLSGVIITIVEPYFSNRAKMAFQFIFGFYIFILCFETMIMNNAWK